MMSEYGTDPEALGGAPLLYQLIVVQTYYILSIPLYIHGILQWRTYKQHLMILKRFPTVSIVTVIVSILNCSMYVVINWIHYISNRIHWRLVLLTQSLSFFVYGLINLRIFMSYLRWQQHQLQIIVARLSDDSQPSKTENKSTTTSTNHRDHRDIWYHPLSVIIISLSIFGAIFIGATPTDSTMIVVWVPWTLMMLINIALVLIIVARKVKDGIGSLKEGLIMFLVFIMVAFCQPLLFIPDVQYVAVALLTLSPWFQGLFPLYFAIYYRQKMDKGADKYTIMHADNLEVSNQQTMEQRVSQFLMYLKEEKNYTAFREYLSFCWALENLQFVENACIIYHVVVQYKNERKVKDTNLLSPHFCSNAQNDEERVYPTFGYLSTMYQKYEQKIGCVCTKKEFGGYKKEMYGIYQEIYDEFIDPKDAPNLINISSETRAALSCLLDRDCSQDNVKKFQSLNDFICLFDDALKEIYMLLTSLYDFQFKNYLKTH
eukprot:320283_1